MNKNEKSLIEHALKIYGMQYNDDIKLGHYSTCIEVSRRYNLQNYSIILHLYNGTADMSVYKSRNTTSNLNINIRSFINHWIQYYNVNEKINCVAVRKCLCDTFDIAFLSSDTVWKAVIIPLKISDEYWIIYNW